MADIPFPKKLIQKRKKPSHKEMGRLLHSKNMALYRKDSAKTFPRQMKTPCLVAKLLSGIKQRKFRNKTEIHRLLHELVNSGKGVSGFCGSPRYQKVHCITGEENIKLQPWDRWVYASADNSLTTR